MTNSDFEDDLDLPKGSPVEVMINEDLTIHSVVALKKRLKALKSEIERTEKAISEKGDAMSSAESYFK